MAFKTTVVAAVTDDGRTLSRSRSNGVTAFDVERGSLTVRRARAISRVMAPLHERRYEGRKEETIGDNSLSDPINHLLLKK